MRTLCLVFLVSSVFLPASGFGAQIRTEFTVINGAEPQSLDPLWARSDAERRIVLALFEGLVTYDNRTSNPTPGLAESWKAGKDGVSYTFRLRKAFWSDGTRITAQTVVDSWLRELDPHSQAPGAGPLADLIAGGRDFQAGHSGPEGVQIRAPDAATLVVTFVDTAPDLSLLATPAAAVLPMHRIRQFGLKWALPENLVGNGPYGLESWIPRTKISVVPNSKYWDQKSLGFKRVTFLPVDVSTGFKLYERGEADWVPHPPQAVIDKAWQRRDFHADVGLGIYYYRLNVTDPTLQDPRIRRALALALDRPALVRQILPGRAKPAYSFSPPFVNYTPPVFTVQENLKVARRLLADGGFPGGKNFPNLIILINTGQTNRRMAEAIQDQWERNLGINVVLKSEDWKTYQEDLGSGNFQIARSAWLGGNDPLTFLELTVTDGPDNNTGFSSPEYDALIAKAQGLSPGMERTKTLTALEALLMTQLPIIPIYHDTNQNLIDLSKWTGWYGNLTDIHPWKNLGPKK